MLVASSRSASTALPNEQNEPGRRLAQAPQPTGDGQFVWFGFVCSSPGICLSTIILPCPLLMGPVNSSASESQFLATEAAAEAKDAENFLQAKLIVR